MFVDIGSGKVRVYVKHERDPAGFACRKHMVPARTTAKVFGPTGDLLGDGYAYCALGDQFVKRQGTKVALKRALARTDLSKQERTAIWRKVWNLPNSVKAT